MQAQARKARRKQTKNGQREKRRKDSETMRSVHEYFGTALKLEHVVKIYVPSTCDVNKVNNHKAEQMTNSAAALLSELFGGATITDANGAWNSAAYGLVKEQIKIVYSFATEEQIEAHADKIAALAEQIKSEMQQEAVSVEIDGALYIV